MSWPGEKQRHAMSARGIKTKNTNLIKKRRIRDASIINIKDYIPEIKRIYELSQHDGKERAIRFDRNLEDDTIILTECSGSEGECVIHAQGGEGIETIATIHTHPRGDAMPSLEDVYNDNIYFENKGIYNYIIGKSVFDERHGEVFGYRLNVRGKEGRRKYQRFLAAVSRGDEDTAYPLMYRDLITKEVMDEANVPFSSQWLEVVDRFNVGDT